MSLKPLSLLAFACLSSLLSGCVDTQYGHLEITQETHPPLDIGDQSFEIASDELIIPVGIAVSIKAVPVSANDQPYTAHDELHLSSSNPSILGVFEEDRTTRVVLAGAHVGVACLRVDINDVEADCFTVRVVPQSPSQE